MITTVDVLYNQQFLNHILHCLCWKWRVDMPFINDMRFLFPIVYLWELLLEICGTLEKRVWNWYLEKCRFQLFAVWLIIAVKMSVLRRYFDQRSIACFRDYSNLKYTKLSRNRLIIIESKQRRRWTEANIHLKRIKRVEGMVIMLLADIFWHCVLDNFVLHLNLIKSVILQQY